MASGWIMTRKDLRGFMAFFTEIEVIAVETYISCLIQELVFTVVA
jgi:hypothetical protein